MKLDFDHLRRTPEYAGMPDPEIEARYAKLADISIEAISWELAARASASNMDLEIVWRTWK